MIAGKGECYVCQICQTTGDDRRTMCHPLFSILVEASVVKDSLGRVVDCTQSSGKQNFRVAKVSI